MKYVLQYEIFPLRAIYTFSTEAGSLEEAVSKLKNEHPRAQLVNVLTEKDLAKNLPNSVR